MLLKSLKEEAVRFKERKIPWIVLFILPILTVLMMGIQFDKEVMNHIPMAIVDLDNSSFSRQLVTAFSDNSTFEIVARPASSQDMEALIQNSEVSVGMIIPQGFYEDVVALGSPTVLMIYDGTSMSVTSTAKAKAVEILLTYKTGAALRQISGRLGLSQDSAMSIARTFSYENRFLYNPSKSFEDFLTPVLMAGYIQAAIALTASVSVDKRIWCMESKERVGYGFGKILFYSIVGTLSYVICVAIQSLFIGTTFKGSMMDVLLLSGGLSFSVSGICVLISSLIRKENVALVAGAVIFIPNSIMVGTTWPVNAMPIGYQAFSAYLPFARFANNLRSIYLKGVDMTVFGKDVMYLYVFGAVVLCMVELTTWLLRKEEGTYDMARGI